MKRHHLLLPFVVLLAACAPSAPPVAKVEYLEEPPAEFPLVGGEAGPNDIALFLAGKPVRRGAVLSRLQQSVNYQQHQREMKRVWEQLASRRVGLMRAWSAANLSPVVSGERVVFYPFGGPDLLHVHALFPPVPNYVMMGLEPVGGVPPLESMQLEEILAALPAYRRATETQLRTGYFITKEMRADLDGGALRGVTPILLGTVALMGGHVDSVNVLSAGGKPGVDLRFHTAGGAARRAVYIEGDLSNSGFGGGYRSYLTDLGRGVTYFKAASYLMHDARFSSAREFFLAQSNAILQDDSGIPFRYFDSSRWKIRYFGDYTGPIELFSKHHQESLRTAFAANPGPPLPFGSGYHWQAGNAHLILVVRR